VADPKAAPEFVSLEGYLVGRLAIAALDKAGKDVTRDGLLKAIKETGRFDIGGLPMTFSATKNEGLDKVFMTIIQGDGTFKPIEKMIKMSSN
jgi:ABC-type branched-subunit amino acid transport system substrate-binding protein